jgi:hypothetical protein
MPNVHVHGGRFRRYIASQSRDKPMSNRSTPAGLGRQVSSGNSGPRIRLEQRTIDAMLSIYCRDHHGVGNHLCGDCEQLRVYAHQRLDVCPFQEQKPVCNRCEVHCYSAGMRERVRDVMRYAGPRMPLRHPWLAFRHTLDKLRRVPSLMRSNRARTSARTTGTIDPGRDPRNRR